MANLTGAVCIRLKFVATSHVTDYMTHWQMTGDVKWQTLLCRSIRHLT